MKFVRSWGRLAMKSNWKTFKLDEFIAFNPKETLKKGTFSKKIAMDILQPFCRDISNYEVTKYTGGTKFRNGDTIMARITPCLENGKTAKINILDTDEIGFGSTEYIVLRAIPNISNEDFIYYLTCSPIIREPAIKSMVGSSGRQRVQINVLQNLEINLPPLETQKKIASILSALDDKIELNNKINENLEMQAQAIFKSWFVDFEPFGGVMPEDWKKSVLSNIANISSGKRPHMRQNEKTENVKIPLIGASSIMGYTNEYNHNDKILVTGRVGTHGIVQRFNYPCWTSDNTLIIKSDYYEYVYQILKIIDYKSINRGSTQPLITQGDLKKTLITIPNKEYLQKYEFIVEPLMNKYSKNQEENQRLAELRDTLLPKLMNGEIDVDDVQVKE